VISRLTEESIIDAKALEHRLHLAVEESFHLQRISENLKQEVL
jgi:hypothetical protein